MANNKSLTRAQAQEALDSIDEDTTAEMVETAIQCGADPNAEGPSGRTPLVTLLEDAVRPDVKVLAALLVGGANPMDGDCALDRAMTNGSWAAIHLLADTAIRQGYRTDEGGCVLHSACRQISGGEQSTALLRLINLGKELTRDLDLPDAPLALQTDDEGNTPLHELWRNGVAISYAEAYDSGEMDPGDGEGEEVAAHWYATSLLLKEGATLDAANNQGETVMDLIHKALEIGLRRPDDSDLEPDDLGRLCAAIDQKTLERDTRPAPGKRSSQRL